MRIIQLFLKHVKRRPLLMTVAGAFWCWPLFAQWQPQVSGTYLDLNSVCFTDINNGWVVGDSGIILHTFDGGETWTRQNSGTEMDISGICFTDPVRGWAAGTDLAAGTILHTLNGGLDWEIVFIDPGIALNAVFFTDSLHGWAVGSQTSLPFWDICMKTVNGGQSWSFQGMCAGDDVYFTDSIHGWSVGGAIDGSTGYTDGLIYNSVDGGESWLLQYSFTSSPAAGSAYLKGIYFTDPDNGWAVGLSHNILHTDDSGENWEFQENIVGPESHFNEVCFPDEFHGWVVGKTKENWSAVVYSTTNGGDEWIQQPCGITYALNSVSFVDTENGWIAGDSGTILHTDNGGVVGEESFKSQVSGITLDCFPNPTKGITDIRFRIPDAGFATLKIFTVHGQIIRELVSQNHYQGKHQIRFDVSALPAGIYLVRLQAGNQTAVEKLIKL